MTFRPRKEEVLRTLGKLLLCRVVPPDDDSGVAFSSWSNMNVGGGKLISMVVNLQFSQNIHLKLLELSVELRRTVLVLEGWLLRSTNRLRGRAEEEDSGWNLLIQKRPSGSIFNRHVLEIQLTCYTLYLQMSFALRCSSWSRQRRRRLEGGL